MKRGCFIFIAWLVFAYFAIADQPRAGVNMAQNPMVTQIQLDKAHAEIRRLRFQLATVRAELAALRFELKEALEKLSALTSIEQAIEQKPEGEQSP